MTPTPEPWRLVEPELYIVGADGPNGPTFIAQVEPPDAYDRHACTAPGAAALANARLLAAAPRFAAIVQELVDEDLHTDECASTRDNVVVAHSEGRELAACNCLVSRARAALKPERRGR